MKWSLYISLAWFVIVTFCFCSGGKEKRNIAVNQPPPRRRVIHTLNIILGRSDKTYKSIKRNPVVESILDDVIAGDNREENVSDDDGDLLASIRQKRQDRSDKSDQDRRDFDQNHGNGGPERKKKRPNFEPYDPERWRCSNWYKSYIESDKCLSNTKWMRFFRGRFRMPCRSFRELVAEARTENWFPKREKETCLGKPGISLDLLMLGSLRYLGRGWTFDDIQESTGVSADVHRLFFHEFVGMILSLPIF